MRITRIMAAVLIIALLSVERPGARPVWNYSTDMKRMDVMLFLLTDNHSLCWCQAHNSSGWPGICLGYGLLLKQ